MNSRILNAEEFGIKNIIIIDETSIISNKKSIFPIQGQTGTVVWQDTGIPANGAPTVFAIC